MKALLPGLALLLAACSTTASMTNDAELRAATQGFYAPYQAASEPPADWDRPIFTADTARLIEGWQAARSDGQAEEGLGDAGWLCECQDWDAAAFGVTITAITHQSPDTAHVALMVSPVRGSATSQNLLLRREQGRWLIEDLFAAEGAPGLRQQLRDAVR